MATVLVLGGVVGLFLLVGGAGRRGGGNGGSLFGPIVAIVELEGLIAETDDLVRELRQHRDNPSIKAEVIRINSPAGVGGPTQVVYDDVHGQFIDAVAKGRKLPREQVVQFADGRVFSGTQALSLKMVDALGALEDAVNAAAKLATIPTPPAVEWPRRRFSFLGLLRNE